MIDTTNRHRFIYALYAVALVATASALSLTHHLQTAGLATEANPVTAAVIGEFGWVGAGALGLGTTMLAFAAIFVALEYAPRTAVIGATVVATVSLLDVANNAALYVSVGMPAPRDATVTFTVVLAWFVVYATVGHQSLAALTPALVERVPSVPRPNRRQLRAIVFSAILVVSLVPAGVAGENSHSLSQNLENDSVYVETATPTTVTSEWSNPVGSYSTGIAHDGTRNITMYNNATHGTVRAVYDNNGTQKWETSISSSDRGYAAEYSDATDRFYLGNAVGDLWVIDPSNGNIINTVSVGTDIRGIDSHPDGDIFVGSGDSLYRMNSDASTQRWSTSYASGAARGVAYSSVNDRVYAADSLLSNSVVVEFSPSDGSQLSSSSRSGGGEYLDTMNGDIYASRNSDGQSSHIKMNSSLGVEWEDDTITENGGVSTHPETDQVAFGTGAGNVTMFDQNGTTLWTENLYSQYDRITTVTSYTRNSTVNVNYHINDDSNGRLSTDTEVVTTQSVSGRVTNGDGEPVANATVRVVGVDWDNLNDSVDNKRDRAEELLEEAENPIPDAWDQNLDVVDTRFDYASDDVEAVAVHTDRDWSGGDPALPGTENPSLDDPHIRLPENEELHLSIWEPVGGTFNVQDNADEDLPGRTTTGTVVVEQLAPDGISTDTYTAETSDALCLGVSWGEKCHETATINPSPGFYHVYPEGSPSTGYTIVVGDPQQLSSHYEDQLEDEAGRLTDHADQIQQNFQDNKFRGTIAETNESGYYSIEVGSSVNLVGVTAVKAGSLNLTGSDNPVAAARAAAENGNLNGSIYLPSQPQRYEPPTSDANLTIRELSHTPYENISRLQDRLDRLQDIMENQSQRVEDLLQQQNATREELERLYNELENTSSENAELRARMEEILNGEIEIDASTATDSELRQRVAAMQQTLQETRDSMESSTDSTTSQQNVTASARFNQELEPDDVTVLAHFSNGTTTTVSNEYETFDEYGTLGGGTEVTVEEYPLGSASTVQFEWIAATDDGHASARETVRNPVINAEPPEVNSVELSTLSPGPSERVGVELNPASDSDYRELTSATVFAPDGTTVATDNITNGRETSFSTNGAGVHTLQLTYTDVDGNEYTRTVRIEAQEQDDDYRPTLRADSGPSGVYAVVGDGIEDGAVTVTESGDLEVQANVGPDGELPHGELHVDTGTVDTNPSGDISVQLVTGPDNEDIDYRAWVYIHDRSTPADNTYVYRNGRPVTQDGNDQGEVRHNSQQNLYKVYTDESGHVSVEVNQPDGFVAKAYESAKFRVLQISVLGVRMPASLPVGGFGLIGLGLFARRRRRVS